MLAAEVLARGKLLSDSYQYSVCSRGQSTEAPAASRSCPDRQLVVSATGNVPLLSPEKYTRRTPKP